MNVFFIRHGQTSWNRRNIIQGQLNTSLDDVGKKQAQDVANKLKKLKKIDLVFSSPLNRAHETLMPFLNFNINAVVYSSLLSERNFGCIEGFCLNETNKNHSDKFKILNKTRNPNFRPAGGESLNDINQRVINFISLLRELKKLNTIICITHGGFLDILFRIVNDYPINSERKWKIPNAGFYEFFFGFNKIKVISWGCVDHLSTKTFK